MALRFFADTALSEFSGLFAPKVLLGLREEVGVVGGVEAGAAGTVGGAGASRAETLAVAFEAACFFARAPCFLAPGVGGGWRGDGEPQGVLLVVGGLVEGALVKTGDGAGGDVLEGFDQEEGVIDLGQRGQRPQHIVVVQGQQVETHVLSDSVINIMPRAAASVLKCNISVLHILGIMINELGGWSLWALVNCQNTQLFGNYKLIIGMEFNGLFFLS
jgi:hypothetical protein